MQFRQTVAHHFDAHLHIPGVIMIGLHQLLLREIRIVQTLHQFLELPRVLHPDPLHKGRRRSRSRAAPVPRRENHVPGEKGPTHRVTNRQNYSKISLIIPEMPNAGLKISQNFETKFRKLPKNTRLIF